MKKQTSSSFPGAVAPTTKKKKLGELDTLLLYAYGGKLPKYKNGNWLSNGVESLSNGLLGFGSQVVGGGILAPIFDAQMEAKADKETKRHSMFAKYGITSDVDPYDAWDTSKYKAYNTGKLTGKVTNEVGKVIAGAMTGMPVAPDVEDIKTTVKEIQNKSYWDMPQNTTPSPYNNTLIPTDPVVSRAPLDVGDVGITDTPLQRYGGYIYPRYANGGDPGDDYNMQGALDAGLTADSTGHWQSVNPKDGMWLKSKEHPTAWKEYLYGYTLNPELNKNTSVVVNPSGYFGNNQLQYIPKKANGGSIEPQYEAEDGEVIQGSTPMVYNGGTVNRKASDMYKLNGNKHTQGGIEASNGEYIFSDKLKVNKKFLSDI